MKPDLRIVRPMPVQKPGSSKQDYETPLDFMLALTHRFGSLDIDLAATDENPKAPAWITPEVDSLSLDWDMLGAKRAFLNPPFNQCNEFASKCAKTERLETLFLIPASVGTNWWAHQVHGTADLVLFLRPRLSFDGLPCSRKKGKVRTCGHDASAHAGHFGKCSFCDCAGFCKEPYVKDCALVAYNLRRGYAPPMTAAFIEEKKLRTRYECWDWLKEGRE